MILLPIAIGCSYRFEELNILGEILKLNFTRAWETHCFCNLNADEFRRYCRLIEFHNIDCFHHVPDDGCSPRNTALNEAKRRQPMMLFLKAVLFFGEQQRDFMWVEGDFIPFDQARIAEPFAWLSEYDVVANHFDFSRSLSPVIENPEHLAQWSAGRAQIGKMPYGYVLPSPLYISGRAARKIAGFISDNLAMLGDGARNHEGNLGLIFASLGLRRRNFSPYFCSSYPYLREVDPDLMFFHPHNLFAAANWLKERGITRGRWLERIVRTKFYFRPVTWRLVTRDPRHEPVLSDFRVAYADSALS